jgi:hypothetical protein
MKIARVWIVLVGAGLAVGATFMILPDAWGRGGNDKGRSGAACAVEGARENGRGSGQITGAERRLAAELGISVDELRRQQRTFDASLRELAIAHAIEAHSTTDITLEQIFEMREEGASWRQIGTEAGLNVTASGKVRGELDLDEDSRFNGSACAEARRAERLAARLGISVEELRAQQARFDVSLRELAMAHRIAADCDITLEEIFAMRAEGASWGEIKASAAAGVEGNARARANGNAITRVRANANARSNVSVVAIAKSGMTARARRASFAQNLRLLAAQNGTARGRGMVTLITQGSVRAGATTRAQSNLGPTDMNAGIGGGNGSNNSVEMSDRVVVNGSQGGGIKNGHQASPMTARIVSRLGASANGALRVATTTRLGTNAAALNRPFVRTSSGLGTNSALTSRTALGSRTALSTAARVRVNSALRTASGVNTSGMRRLGVTSASGLRVNAGGSLGATGASGVRVSGVNGLRLSGTSALGLGGASSVGLSGVSGSIGAGLATRVGIGGGLGLNR